MPLIAEMAQLSPLPSALKRKSSLTDISPQTKRSKVSFNTVDNVHFYAKNNVKPLSLVEEEVRRALIRHRQHDNIEYNMIKSLFTTDPQDEDAPSDQLLHHHLQALSSQVLAFSDNSGDLVYALLNSNWLYRDDQFVVDLTQFLSVLLTTYNGYLTLVLKWVVQNFVGIPQVIIKDSPVYSESQIFDRLHKTLQYILLLVPSSKAVLESILDSTFPYHAAPTTNYINHVRNLFRIKSYSPDLAPLITRLVIEKTLNIDVQVGIDLDLLEEEDQETLVEQVRQSLETGELEASLGEEEEEESDVEEDEDAVEKAEFAMKKMKGSMIKLDSSLNTLFQYYDDCLQQQEKALAFNQLISLFNRSILSTYNSRCMQYLLFRFAQLDKTVYDSFLSSLTKSAFDRNLALPTRCAAVSYLASFTARGGLLDDSDVRNIFASISSEVEKLRKSHEPKVGGPDSEKYRFYYGMFQAIMYIFCFRWKSFLLEAHDDDGDDGYRWLPDIKEMFNRQIMSKLNPLKVCAPVLVGMFAKITKHLSFLYLYSRIEANKRVRLVRSIQFAGITRESSLKVNESALQLTNQYAFEPYILPVSKKWIAGLYLNFDDVCPAGMDNNDESDDDDDSDDDNSDAGSII